MLYVISQRPKLDVVLLILMGPNYRHSLQSKRKEVMYEEESVRMEPFILLGTEETQKQTYINAHTHEHTQTNK